MKKKVTISVLVAGALVAVTLLGVIGYRTVSAASNNDAVAGRINFKSVADRAVDTPQDEYLAEALGITVEELDAAQETARLAALDKAVEEGLITQAQADTLKERQGVFPFGNRWAGWLSEKGIDYQALLADALGITVEDLQAAHTRAFEARLDQAVADGRLTQEEADLIKARSALYGSEAFQTAMQTAFEAAVQQAVTDGILTQAQADQILAERADKPFGRVWGFDKMPRGGRMHDRFGGRGMGDCPFQAPVTPDTETTPSSGSGL